MNEPLFSLSAHLISRDLSDGYTAVYNRESSVTLFLPTTVFHFFRDNTPAISLKSYAEAFCADEDADPETQIQTQTEIQKDKGAPDQQDHPHRRLWRYCLSEEILQR